MTYTDPYALLLQSLQKVTAIRQPGPVPFTEGQIVSAGLEALSPGTGYLWDGLRRGVDAGHPFVVVQYTLAGWGLYEEQGVLRRVLPGDAFTALVPSAHVYRLPPESPGWTYFWILFNHPTVVARLGQAKGVFGAVTALDPEALAVARLVRVFEGVCQGGFRDRWAQEQALFEFLWEYERHRHGQQSAPPERERILADVRRLVLSALERTPDVASLARTWGMSRSHFSHHFKALTGQPPAQFVTQIRLEEVARLLLETAQTLDQIAAATGFADANHLCKVFRRHSHLSPGAFRRQMR